MFRALLSRTVSTAANASPKPQFAAKNFNGKPGISGNNLPEKKFQFAKVLQKAPFFKCPAVVNGEFKDVSLEDYKGKTLVLFFYPLDFTYVCPTEIINFNDRAKEFEKLGAEIAAISVDSVNSHLAWTKVPRSEGGLGPTQIPIISDIRKFVSKYYGVLEFKKGVALRGTFIIDKNSIIRHMSINDLTIGRSVDETLRLIEAMNHADEHGEVCPVNWKKGEVGIKPTPEDAKNYFQSTNPTN